MKYYFLLSIFTLLLLTGCTPKSNLPITFGSFTMKLYNNNKKYVILPLDTAITQPQVIKKIKEKMPAGNTGFINSLVIVKTPIQSWTDMKTLVAANTKTLQIKLLKYMAITNTSKKIQCKPIQYSWYITSFSYELDKQTLYDGQYFFTDDTSLYIISLTSEDQKDIKSFIKSINTLKCN